MRLSPDDFMWMGRVQAASGVALELYKHYATGQYLNATRRGTRTGSTGAATSCGGGRCRRSRTPPESGDLRVLDERRRPLLEDPSAW
jgi:hypothetical protein